MNDMKYTNDGKKVVVIGRLNAQENIVQEVFVTTKGDEIPSGENFVVKSLHDEPVETYKTKREKELEERLKILEKQIREEENKARKYRELVLKPLDEKARCIKALVGDKAESYKQLIDFITGNIKYVVIGKWNLPEIKTYEEFLEMLNITENDFGENRHAGLRLVSLFGSSDGKVDYKIHTWSDGSGGNEEIYPANDYQEAIGIAIEIISKKDRYTEAMIRFLKDNNAEIDRQKYRAWYINAEKIKIDNNAQSKRRLEEAVKELKKSEDDLEYFRKSYEYPEEVL